MLNVILITGHDVHVLVATCDDDKRRADGSCTPPERHVVRENEALWRRKVPGGRMFYVPTLAFRSEHFLADAESVD